MLGIMSGSSLDGVDLAICEFEKSNEQWNYNILAADCIKYSKIWENRLRKLPNSSAKVFCQTHFDYGHLLGEMSNNFLQKNNLKADLIASHGHTIFHSPQTKMTMQIGDGAAIAMQTNTQTVCDLRTTDIAYGGQGAPIVPLVDKLLFADYKAHLNIGGIANISIQKDNKIIAFDICPANQVLNFLANKLEKEYDDGGKIAESGKLNNILFNQLNKIDYYQRPIPKSMANGWIRSTVLPIIAYSTASTEDKLRTVVAHIAFQFQNALQNFEINTPVLATGGGAYNRFLIQEIEKLTGLKMLIPTPLIVEYKEALAMAFLGLLRFKNEVNVLASVTGASKNTVNGALYCP